MRVPIAPFISMDPPFSTEWRLITTLNYAGIEYVTPLYALLKGYPTHVISWLSR